MFAKYVIECAKNNLRLSKTFFTTKMTEITNSTVKTLALKNSSNWLQKATTTVSAWLTCLQKEISTTAFLASLGWHNLTIPSVEYANGIADLVLA